MISIVVYGRNDSHGYNLHKRAALSLNAIAHVLDDPDDEIVFVDYNTPDELPTFLEVIADTLTDAAKQRIRVIRVRPAYHARFAEQTALVALESQSRNIAVRRTNPANRWILSTNTDMVFVPREADASLTRVCAELADGFYHLPRFEVPEGFWEREERDQPGAVIESMRVNARRFHLNEIVHGGYDNLYEGPGDFQLFLREDIFAIGGFDERMILGWHVDTNVARRMRFLRGKVDTVYPALSGYHCGHTRQATSLHGARRTENDLLRFVRDIVSPYWTDDADAWGAPSEAFEETHLRESRRQLYLSALSRAVETPAIADATVATYNETNFCEQGFSAAHVLPHLADVIFNMKSGQSVFVIASDHQLIDGFAKFAAGAPLNFFLTLCEDGASPGIGRGLPLAPLARGLAEADLVLLQYPNVDSVNPADRADLEWFAQRALETFIDLERRKPSRERRRIVVVNGTHNLLQDAISANLDAAAMPYSSRLRQGRVADAYFPLHPPASDAGPDYAVCEALGRQRRFSQTERELLARAVQRAPGWERLARELIAIAAHKPWMATAQGVEPRLLAETEVLAHDAVKAAAARAHITPVAVGARIEFPNRLCSGADWEDEAWFALAERYFGERIYSLPERSRWVWERISLAKQLQLCLPEHDRPWILLVSETPDMLALLLCHRGYRVAFTTAGGLLGGEEPDWRQTLRVAGVVAHSGLASLSSTPAGVRFEAVVAPSAALFSRGPEALDALLTRISPRMAPEAHLGASMLVHLNQASGGGAISYQEFVSIFADNGLLGARNFYSEAPVDERIPLDAVLKFAFRDEQGDSVPGLSFGFDEAALVTIGQVWARFGGASQPRLTPSAPASAETAAAASALRERVVLYPSVFAHTRRDLTAFVVAQASTSSRVRYFAVPIGAFTKALNLEVALAGQGEVSAEYIGADGLGVRGAVARGRDHARLSFAQPSKVGDGLVIIALEGGGAVVNGVWGWLEAGETVNFQLQFPRASAAGNQT